MKLHASPHRNFPHDLQSEPGTGATRPAPRPSSRGLHFLMPWRGVVVIPLLAACSPQGGILAPAGELAERQLSHLLMILYWMLPVALPLFLVLPLIIWRFRLRGSGRYRPKWEFSWPLEILVWGLPVAVVCVLGFNLWRDTLSLDPYAPRGTKPPLQIQAIAYDWKWLFIYPAEGIAAADRLVLPQSRPIRLKLTSATVLQAFSIPRIGGQIYAMPGMATEFNLRTGAAGTFVGQNMQYNGDQFAHQSFEVKVISDSSFADWAQRMRRAPGRLDGPALKSLARRNTLRNPRFYGGIEGDPFGDAMKASLTGTDRRTEEGL